MKQKVLIHQFDPVIYPFKLWVCITDNLSAISERFNEYPSGNEFEVTNTEKMLAFTQNVQQKSDGLVGSIIVFKKKKDCITRLIAHESTHAARMLWDHVGERESGMEADAYLVGWIADCIEKVRLNKF